ncbi:MAG TPA: hypothetical protein VGI86_15010, partial [Acidimicrobiia bacterium]
MDRSAAVAVLSALCSGQRGVFRGRDAVARGGRRTQLQLLCEIGIIERLLPNTYRMTSVPRSDEQWLRASLLWAGRQSAADGQSAGWWYDLQGVRAPRPQIVVADPSHCRCRQVHTRRVDDLAPLMIRRHRGLPVTGVEATIVRLAHLLDDEALEIAFEDARRRKLTTMPAMQAYLDRHSRRGQRGVATLRALLRELDPTHPSRSTLEVKTRRLLRANGINDFVREFPLDGYFFDFGFVARHTILETNGKRWHDDPVDY